MIDLPIQHFALASGQGELGAVGVQGIHRLQIANLAHQAPARAVRAVIAVDGAVIGVGGSNDYHHTGPDGLASQVRNRRRIGIHGGHAGIDLTEHQGRALLQPKFIQGDKGVIHDATSPLRVDAVQGSLIAESCSTCKYFVNVCHIC